MMNSNQVVDVWAEIFFTLRDLEDADEVAMFNYRRARMSNSSRNEQFARLGFPRVRLRRAPRWRLPAFSVGDSSFSL